MDLPPIFDLFKVLAPAAVAFFTGIAVTPFLTHYLYRYRAWKKKPGKTALGGEVAHTFNALHSEREVSTPRMGGVVIWASTLLTMLLLWFLAKLLPDSPFAHLDFLSRNQTWVPLFALAVGSVVGLIDDILEIREHRPYLSGGLSLTKRLSVVALVALVAGSWFYFKLDVTSIGIPFGTPLEIGILVIPLFMFITLCLYASGIIDGIDGLSGGVFASIFGAYAALAFSQEQYDLGALCATLVGAILAFLWFNIPPARFYMSETGTMALTLTLSVVAFMTDTLGEGVGVALLPIIALPLVITVLSAVIQVLSKRLRGGKKVFRIAPLHHHFEAIGWPPYKVTMRYWVLSMVFAITGLLIGFVA